MWSMRSAKPLCANDHPGAAAIRTTNNTARFNIGTSPGQPKGPPRGILVAATSGDQLDVRAEDVHLYAIAALVGPASGCASIRRNPAAFAHPSKSSSV